MKTIHLILLCVLLNTSGELLMKYGMTVFWAASALCLLPGAMVMALTHGWHRFLRMKEWRLRDWGGRSEVSGNRRRP